MTSNVRVAQRPATTVPMMHRAGDEFTHHSEHVNDYHYKRPLENDYISDTSRSTNDFSFASNGAISPTVLRSTAASMMPRKSGKSDGDHDVGGQLITVKLIKGQNGFGFTIANSRRGQVIRHINDPARCRYISSGDVIVAINGVWVRDRSHDAVVDALRRCELDRPTELTLLTAATQSQQPAAIVNGSSHPSSRRQMTNPDSNMDITRGGDYQTNVRTEQSKYEPGCDYPVASDRLSAAVSGGNRRGENGIRQYKTNSRALPTSSHLNASFGGEVTLPMADDSNGYNRSNGYQQVSNKPHGEFIRGQTRFSSSSAATESIFTDRNDNNISIKAADGDVFFRRPHSRQEPYITNDRSEIMGKANYAKVSTPNSAFVRRPVSTTPMMLTSSAFDETNVERQKAESKFRRKSTESSSTANETQSSKTGRLTAIFRRPITPVLQRRSKNQQREATEQERQRRGVNGTGERPPSVTSSMTRTSSQNSLQNFSGTPNFIPASVYGGGPLDGLVGFRSTVDDADDVSARCSLASSQSAAASTKFRPASSSSGHYSATSSVLCPTPSPQIESRKTSSQCVSTISADVPDAESSSVGESIAETQYSLSSTSFCNSIPQSTISESCLSTASQSSRTTGDYNGTTGDLDGLSSTAYVPGQMAKIESLFSGREMCNGYNVRTETVYSTQTQTQAGKRCNMQNRERPASIVPRVVGKELLIKVPPSQGVTTTEARRVSPKITTSGASAMPSKMKNAEMAVDVVSMGSLDCRLLKSQQLTPDMETNQQLAVRPKSSLGAAVTERLSKPSNGNDVVSPKPGDTPPPLPSPETMNAAISAAYYEIELHRGSRGFGFSVRGGAEFGEMPIFVLDIAKGGSADMDGRLKSDDQIVAINGVTADNMAHATAVELIQNSCSPLQLIVKRINIKTKPIENDNRRRCRRELPATPTNASSLSLISASSATGPASVNGRHFDPPIANGHKTGDVTLVI